MNNAPPRTALPPTTYDEDLDLAFIFGPPHLPPDAELDASISSFPIHDATGAAPAAVPAAAPLHQAAAAATPPRSSLHTPPPIATTPSAPPFFVTSSPMTTQSLPTTQHQLSPAGSAASPRHTPPPTAQPPTKRRYKASPKYLSRPHVAAARRLEKMPATQLQRLVQLVNEATRALVELENTFPSLIYRKNSRRTSASDDDEE